MTAARAPPRRKPASARRRSACSAHDSIARDGSDENGSHRRAVAMTAPVLTDGELILVAGALLAAGLLASLLAGRAARARPAAVPRPRDGHRLRRPGLDRLRRLRARAHDRDHRAGADPVRGRPDRRAARDPAGARRPRSAWRSSGTLVTAVVTGLAAAWLFDLSTLEGLLLGAMLAATDGAAIFALLRGSTLKRRLARTLEGEAGFNDPVAVLLVLGFIEWIQHAGLRRSPTWPCCFVRQLGIGARRRASPSAVAAVVGAAARAAGHRRACTRSRRWPSPRSPSAAPTRCTARASSPSTSPGSLLGTRGHPRPADGRPPSTRAWPGSRRWRCSSRSGLLVFPSQLGDVALEGTRARARARRSSRGRWRSRVATLPFALHVAPSGSCSAGPGCAARCRSCSRPSR